MKFKKNIFKMVIHSSIPILISLTLLILYLIFIKKAIIEFNLLSLSYLLVNKFYISLYSFTPFVYNSFDNINTHKV